MEETSPPGSTFNTADTKFLKDKTDDQSRQKGGTGVYRFYLQRSEIGAVVCFIAAMNLEAACGNVACKVNKKFQLKYGLLTFRSCLDPTMV